MPPLLRFAPSPTGFLHLGGLRTALLNYLFAQKHGGKWILRIEDTDQQRLVQGSADDIRRSLEWAGLEYNYGPGIGGPHAPYVQSERIDIYRQYVSKLLEKGHAYHCFCSPERLKAVRESLQKRRSNKTYDKSCLHLSDEDVHRRLKAGHDYCIRLNDETIPEHTTPHDLIFGELHTSHKNLATDPIILKSDGTPTYHLASVVDDYEMGITHVLRGEEWLPSLPLHLDLYACLDLTPPRFAHLPLLLNPDRSKMSKRAGDVSVTDYIKKGWPPQAILNWLALAGWGVNHDSVEDKQGLQHSKSLERSAPDSTEVLTLPELIEKFDLSSLTPRRSILDPKKLEYLSKHHTQRLIEADSDSDPGELVLKAKALLEEEYPFSTSQISQLDIKNILHSVKGRITNLSDLSSLLKFLFDCPKLSSTESQTCFLELKLKPERYAQVIDKYLAAMQNLEVDYKAWNGESIHALIATREARDEMLILRHALSRQKIGLPLSDTLLLLGWEETYKRLTDAKAWGCARGST